MKTNVAGVVILYHPNENETFQNILSYSKHLSKLYIFDNSSTESSIIKSKLNELNSNCYYFHDGSNEGIALRLNTVIKMANEDGFSWLLTMDQDSSFQENGFQNYLEQINNYPNENVAIFGVNFLPKLFGVSNEAKEVLSTITSGSVVNLLLAKNIGNYNEDLFIDLVDAEYSYRAIQKGYKIVQFKNVILNHEMGYKQPGRSLKNFKVTLRIMYSPTRIYYIVRNSFWMLYKFSSLPKSARKEIWTTLALLKNSIIYHKERRLVFKYIIKGYWDYKRNKMGKLEIN